MTKRAILLQLGLTLALYPQTAVLQRVTRTELPPVIDGNSAAFWAGDKMYLFHSTGVPHLSSGHDQFHLGDTHAIQFNSADHKPAWFESVWRDDDGTLFLFYHHEPEQRCPTTNLTSPRIGAAISRDNGETIEDLGIILQSGDPDDCDAKNGFFSGGHGDMSVVLDKEHKYFYFYFTNYAGPVSSQGVATARLAFEDRFHPEGKVFKFYMGEWNEPGVGGKISPVFPATRSWQVEDTDSHWGPAIHYNTHLDKYVVLLNRACCEPGWPQAGIDVSFNADLSDAFGWKPLQRLLNPGDIPHAPGYYPQVLGLSSSGTDALSGEFARFYVMGVSDWEIQFYAQDPEPASSDVPCSNPDIPCPANLHPKKQ